MATEKLWGGRFTTSPAKILENLNASIGVDKRMYAEDIEGSQAYAVALEKIGLLTKQESDSIQKGLDQVKMEWSKNTFEIRASDEDIHTANERRLKELIGEPATKLHVGRSRNDQVITDMRLWLRKHLKNLNATLKGLIGVMLQRADKEIDVIMPGYTHMQRAQPVRWSHYLLSHIWSLKNDSDRLDGLMGRVNVMPLGSGALAGNPFGIDREDLARNLQFAEISRNSMQAVSDRDFIAEFLFWASLVGVHLSRLAEDFVIYSSKEFDFIKIDDSFSTGSSLMPQKRNPDGMELIRGVGGSLFGQCCTFMMVLKGLPSTYNKDLQSDKELMFSAYDKLKSILEVTAGTIETLTINKEKCTGALNYEMLATDVAYYLVRKGVPFRQAHHLAGQVVSAAEKKSISLAKLSLAELKQISDVFEEDVAKVWNYENSVEQYQTVGGTAKKSVVEQIGKISEWLK